MPSARGPWTPHLVQPTRGYLQSEKSAIIKAEWRWKYRSQNAWLNVVTKSMTNAEQYNIQNLIDDNEESVNRFVRSSAISNRPEYFLIKQVWQIWKVRL